MEVQQQNFLLRTAHRSTQTTRRKRVTVSFAALNRRGPTGTVRKLDKAKGIGHSTSTGRGVHPLGKVFTFQHALSLRRMFMEVVLAILFGVFVFWATNKLRRDETERRAEQKRLGLKRDDGYIYDQKGVFGGSPLEHLSIAHFAARWDLGAAKEAQTMKEKTKCRSASDSGVAKFTRFRGRSFLWASVFCGLRGCCFAVY
jgi:hypothetical protein